MIQNEPVLRLGAPRPSPPHSLRFLVDHHPIDFFTPAPPNLPSAPKMTKHFHLVFRQQRY